MTREYYNLINKVADLGHKDAVVCLKEEVPHFRSFCDWSENIPESLKLQRLFLWRESRQGHQFWRNLCTELEAQEGESDD